MNILYYAVAQIQINYKIIKNIHKIWPPIKCEKFQAYLSAF